MAKTLRHKKYFCSFRPSFILGIILIVTHACVLSLLCFSLLLMHFLPMAASGPGLVVAALGTSHKTISSVISQTCYTGTTGNKKKKVLRVRTHT